MKFKAGGTYMTRNGKAVEIVSSGTSIHGRFVGTRRSEVWDLEGRRNNFRRSPIDLTEAVYRTPLQDGGPIVTPITPDLLRANFVNKPTKSVALTGQTLYAAEIQSKYPGQPFFSPLFLTRPEVTKFCNKYGHRIVAELTVSAARA